MRLIDHSAAPRADECTQLWPSRITRILDHQLAVARASRLTVMALTVVLLAATVIGIVCPGPGRAAAGGLKPRLGEDRVQRAADPQGQPAVLARPAPAGRDH
jgi:hypothetical protein